MSRMLLISALSAHLLIGCYADPFDEAPELPLASSDDDDASDDVTDDDDAALDDDDVATDDDDAATIAADDAVIVSASIPTSLDCGESMTARVTVRNTGSALWTRSTGFKLGAVDDSDPFVGPDPRVWLQAGDSVPPGGEFTFSLDMTAPDEAGSYMTDWRMVHEAVRWFGETQSTTVEVACSAPAWVQVACARNGSEICDDESFGVDASTTYGVLCEGPNNGIGYVSTNTGPQQEDGMNRCQGWEDQGLDAWDYLAYIDQFVCDTQGEVLVVDLTPWAGGSLWFGSHDNPNGGGHMTNICLVELVE